MSGFFLTLDKINIMMDKEPNGWPGPNIDNLKNDGPGTTKRGASFNSGWLIGPSGSGEIKVSIYENAVYIEGSIAKFITVHGIGGHTPEKIGEAFRFISEKLYIPLNILMTGRVKQLEIAKDFSMESPVKQYLDLFGSLGVCEKLKAGRGPGSIYYYLASRGDNQFAVYDKSKELPSDLKRMLPSEWRGKHIMRLELRARTNPGGILDIQDIKVSDLCTEAGFEKFNAAWNKQFSKIKFNKEMQVDFENIPELPDPIKLFAARHIQEHPEAIQEYMALFDRIGKTQKIPNHRQKKSDRKRKIDALQTNPALNVESELVKELKEKIRAAGIGGGPDLTNIDQIIPDASPLQGPCKPLAIRTN